MPFLIGLLAALGVGAIVTRVRADERREVSLLRAVTPYAGKLDLGMIAMLAARQFAIEGETAPRAFKVQIVGVPDAGTPLYTAVLLENVPPMRATEFLQFSADKVSQVVPA